MEPETDSRPTIVAELDTPIYVLGDHFAQLLRYVASSSTGEPGQSWPRAILEYIVTSILRVKKPAG